jgi:hypothetical protein
MSHRQQEEEVQGAIFLLENSVFAFYLTAPILDRLVVELVEGKISQAEHEKRLNEEVRAARMILVRDSPRVEVTGNTLGCLAEFTIPGTRFEHRLCYTYAMSLEARPI